AGAFLISANGTEELLHLNEKNSPLFSNQINDIIIDNTNGEIFFATDKGIISYRGTASEAKEDYNDVMVFPNPVRENYQGTISVSGLMYHSFCKIVDAAGNLVWQGFAEGGQLNWNGKDFYGKKPATGVYYVFSSDETGKQRNVAKILFIK
ncbi:MAG TPA: Por secretion system protein, partial [Bacteroidales bacterium]|nr:Por secretion system protein [Bacteroidales bacterium]